MRSTSKFVALSCSFAITFFGNIPAQAAPGNFNVGGDVSYVEDASAITALSDFSLSDASQDYSGGSVTLSLGGTYESGEILGFQQTNPPSILNGQISVNNGTIFKGDGTNANAIGNVDSTSNGQGRALKVNFSNSFTNGDFSLGSTGWSVTDGRVYLGYMKSDGTVVQGTTQIGGFTPPVDTIWGPGNVNTSRDITNAPNSTSSSFSSGNLTMTMGGGSCDASFCVLRGPYVISNSSVYLTANDSVSFDWSASASGDGFDVYGYVLNTSTGKAIRLIDETGRDSQSSGGRVTAVMGSARNETNYFTSGSRRSDLKRYAANGTSATGTSVYNDAYYTDGSSFEAGNYKFVFIAGSYDDSGGRYLGASFTIDNVAVSSNTVSTVNAANIQSLVRQATYFNSTGANTLRTLSFTSSLNDTTVNAADASKDITISQSNDAPVLGSISPKTYSDTTSNDDFSNYSATLNGTDEEGATLTYGITGATISGSTATLNNTYGVLTLNTSTGAFTFTPNDSAINALDSSQTTTFTLTVSDGVNSGSGNFTITFSGVVDALPSSPTINSISSGDQSLVVDFTAPVSSGTSSVSNYKYSTDGTNYFAFSPAQTTSPLTIRYLSTDGTTALVNGTSYTITIKAVNTTGDSSASNSVSGTPAISSSSGGSGGGGSAAATPTPTPTATSRSNQTNSRVLTAPVITGNRNPQSLLNPTAIIGGVPTTTTTRVIDQNKLNILAGQLSLEVKVTDKQGSVGKSTSGDTELQVKKGGLATVSGNGVRPLSTVQVFLPLQGSNSKEIGRMTATNVGSFSGEALFATAIKDEPLPIGRQILQIVSLDKSGNQSVVDMPVNIAQPVPAPEQNRQSGLLPNLTFGTSFATSAGLPTEVVLETLEQDRTAIVQGDGWSMSIEVPESNGQVKKAGETISLKLVQNKSAFVSGTGFLPNTRADIWLFSDPTLLGTVDIDADGNFSGQIEVVGKLVPIGEHTLQVQGVGTDGFVRAANLGVLVEAGSPSTLNGSIPLWAYATTAAGLLTVFWFFVIKRRKEDEPKHIR